MAVFLDIANEILAKYGITDLEWEHDFRRQGRLAALPHGVEVVRAKALACKLNVSPDLLATWESWIDDDGFLVVALWCAPASQEVADLDALVAVPKPRCPYCGVPLVGEKVATAAHPAPLPEGCPWTSATCEM